jgi:CBS domain-containing protein
MNVKTILSVKGSHVTTIEPNANLEAAVALLAKHRIGALVVLGADERVIGILSERDIVRALAELGACRRSSTRARHCATTFRRRKRRRDRGSSYAEKRVAIASSGGRGRSSGRPGGLPM